MEHTIFADDARLKSKMDEYNRYNKDELNRNREEGKKNCKQYILALSSVITNSNENMRACMHEIH